MTNEEAITYANCLKNNYTINFEDMTDFCDMAIKALAKHDYFIEKINRESYIRGYNKAMSNILLAYDKSDYPEESNYYVYQELNKWEKEGVSNEQ